MNDKTATANLVGDKYIELTFLRENITLNANEVKFGWKLAQEISPQKSMNVLLKTGDSTLLDKKAREYVLAEFKEWPRVAIVVDNTGQRLMGQVIINLTGNSAKLKLFNNINKAQEWIVS
ncbi:MAG: hypothetical protein V4638_11635 [Bacteroidota bacterium]